jgi:hypothetical protein
MSGAERAAKVSMAVLAGMRHRFGLHILIEVSGVQEA